MSSPKAIPPEKTLAGSREASALWFLFAEHHQRAQHNEPRAEQANQGPDLKNPAPRNRDSLAKLLIVSLQITALLKICSFFQEKLLVSRQNHLGKTVLYCYFKGQSRLTKGF